MKILIVEDEKRLALLLKKGFEESSFVVDVCHDGGEGLYMAETFPYDALILDVMLPEIDGFTLLAKLREKRIETPILMLTARGEVEDRVRGLTMGADDYLPKPFDFIEVLARVTAIIRRNKGRATSILQVHDLRVNIHARTVQRGGNPISLSPKEYAILEYLILNKGRAISRTEFSEHVYDMNFDLDSNIIDVYINRLRKKIDHGRKDKLIRTQRGAGYIIGDEQ